MKIEFADTATRAVVLFAVVFGFWVGWLAKGNLFPDAPRYETRYYGAACWRMNLKTGKVQMFIPAGDGTFRIVAENSP